METELSSALNNWISLLDFHHYRYNNIAAQLYLLKQSNTRLLFKANEYLNNHIKGGSKEIKAILPSNYL